MSSDFFKSRKFWIPAVILGELIVLLLVFRLGMLVGFRKANFSFRWGENYHQLFGGPRHGWLGQFGRDDYINSGNVAGSVIKTSSSTITVNGMGNVEESVFITSSTVITENRQNISLKDIKTNDRITAIGAPSTSGQLEAKFIRVFPAR